MNSISTLAVALLVVLGLASISIWFLSPVKSCIDGRLYYQVVTNVYRVNLPVTISDVHVRCTSKPRG